MTDSNTQTELDDRPPVPEPVPEPAPRPGRWRALAEHSLALDGVDIHMRRRLDADQVEVATGLMIGVERRIVEQGVEVLAPPLMRLDDEMAGALLRALAAYYGSADTLHAEVSRIADRVEEIAEHVMGGGRG